MALEIAQSIQQTTFDHFNKVIKEQADNKPNIIKTMIEIFENQSLNTFSEFLRMEEIDEVCEANYIMNYHLFNQISLTTAQSRRIREILQHNESVRIRHIPTVLGKQTQAHPANSGDGQEIEASHYPHIGYAEENFAIRRLNGRVGSQERSSFGRHHHRSNLCR
jgi:glutathione peroxidase-family protein